MKMSEKTLDDYSSGKCVVSFTGALLWLGLSSSIMIVVYNIIWVDSWEISLPVISGMGILIGLIIFCIGCFVKSRAIYWAVFVMLIYECMTLLSLIVCFATFFVTETGDDDGVDGVDGDDGDDGDDGRNDALLGTMIILIICGCCAPCLHGFPLHTPEIHVLPTSRPTIQRIEEKKPIIKFIPVITYNDD